MDGGNEMEGYMWMGGMKCKGTCGWGDEMEGYMWMGE